MKKIFIKNQGRVEEKLELTAEEKWIYAYYRKGNYEKTAYILRNEEKSLYKYLEDFLKENKVSEELKKSVEKFLTTEKSGNSFEWKNFTEFLLRSLSLHVMIGFTLALMIFGGFKLGAFLDAKLDIYPALTVTGVLSGMALGGLTGFMMIGKYTNPKLGKNRHKTSRNKPDKNQQNNKSYPVIDVTVEQVRNAIRTYSEDLPKGVYRTILVDENNCIDFTPLAPILKGIPSKKFYMSKETYEIFEENEKEIPLMMDKVQKAVDAYVRDHKKYPMLQFDPERRVNFYLLSQEQYLDSHPPIDFYITDYDGLVSHIKPKRQTST